MKMPKLDESTRMLIDEALCKLDSWSGLLLKIVGLVWLVRHL